MLDYIWLALVAIIVLTIVGGIVFFVYDSVVTLLQGEA